MTNTELLGIFRTETFDLQAPYLWSDALIYRYIDDAQKQFCRDTYGIADARTFSVSVLADGTEWYTLDPRILKIRTAVDSVTGRPVDLVPVEKMALRDMRFDGQTGWLKAFVTGLEKHVLRAWPVPNVASTVKLTVFRLSTTLTTGASFEIDDQHVLPLLFWVKHKAYGVQDTETYDKQAADKNLALWNAYCARAKDEQSRTMHQAGTVGYGGI